MPGSRVYSVWLPDALVALVDEAAAVDGASRNQWVKAALESAVGVRRLGDPGGDRGLDRGV